MKSTTLDITNSGIIRQRRVHLPDRWKAFPFLVLMFTSGLPLNYKLEQARPLTVADAAELTLQAASDQNVANSIFFVLLIGALYLLSGSMLLKKPKVVLALLFEQWPLTLLLLFITVSVFWSNEQGKVLSNIIHNFGTVFIAIAAAMYYRHEPWAFPRQLGYVLGVNMLLQVAAVFLIPSYAIDWQGRWHGLTTHPNTLGAMAFTTLWANASVLICKKSDKPFLHLLFSVASVAAMIGADSVTSMMTSFSGLLSIYIFNKLNTRGVGQRFYVSVLVIATVLILVAVTLGNAFNLNGLFEFFGRDPNFTGRTSVWSDAWKAISERPLLGWSFDDHSFLIQKGMPYPSYHNGLLDTAVSGGLTAIVLMFLLIFTWTVSFTKSSQLGKQIAPFSASFVIAYLIHNQTESSLISPRAQMWEIFLVLILLGACKRLSTSSTSQPVASPSLPPLQFDNAMNFSENKNRQIGGAA